MTVFLQAFLMIFFAEMGDKSQILAMSLAAKYPLKKVVVGITLGVVANHAIAIGVGYFVGQWMPGHLMGGLAGILFLLFGFQALSLDEEEEDAYKGSSYSVILAIAFAFFMGEFGDKTQLTTIVLASEATWPLLVMAGTVSAMLATAGLGIFLGIAMGKNLPEVLIKLVSGGVFILFGSLKLQTSVALLQTPLGSMALLVTVVGLTTLRVHPLIVEWRSKRLLPMQNAAERLRTMQHELKQLAEGTCLGKNVCGQCMGNRCILGQTKALIAQLDTASVGDQDLTYLDQTLHKAFNLTLVVEALNRLLDYQNMHQASTEAQTRQIDLVRSRYELILFKEAYQADSESYAAFIKRQNHDIAQMIRN